MNNASKQKRKNNNLFIYLFIGGNDSVIYLII